MLLRPRGIFGIRCDGIRIRIIVEEFDPVESLWISLVTSKIPVLVILLDFYFLVVMGFREGSAKVPYSSSGRSTVDMWQSAVERDRGAVEQS